MGNDLSDSSPLKHQATRCLLVVPPFCDVFMPSLAAHLVHDVLTRSEINTKILYANLIAADLIGFKVYHTLAASHQWLVCERLISLALHKRSHPKVPSATNASVALLIENIKDVFRDAGVDQDAFSVEDILTALDLLEAKFLKEVEVWRPDIIAFTSTFQTITAVELLANAVKSRTPSPPHIIVGGANADGEMALGLRSFMISVDHIFSGELDDQLSQYCRDKSAWSRGITRSKGIYPPYEAYIDYDAFFEQCREYNHPHMDTIWLPLETSRGCWFGEKSHCTFCGLNGSGMKYRAKEGVSAVDEYRHYREKYAPKGFFMVDNIIPKNFFEEFLKPIAALEGVSKADIFYEVKANLSVEEIRLMRDAGASAFQPGIEALSTPLLKHMKKGTSAFVNLRTLFWAKQSGIKCVWNLLARFPNDKENWYQDTLQLLPYIRHFQPPQQSVSKVSIDRFSPHFDRSSDFGIRNIKPAPLYEQIFADVDLNRLAYHFTADFETEFNEDICGLLDLEIAAWRAAWKRRPPTIEAFILDNGGAIVVDTRNTINAADLVVDEFGAVPRLARSDCNESTEEWLISRGLAMRVEGRLVNLIERVHSSGMAHELPFLMQA
ncbi:MULTISPECIES: RiPP maturation radical SAM C-methyltransferase [Agrobacterium]|uniref:RiPP maturation radical SAM protein 1 n=1 Tax=Agrobacterium tumefaciens TaxID=358 RepID=A0AAE6BG55_AGRTU|nr:MULTISPECIES: RiPP maturation radical SAM C-methyltransferase [Agrobacterium]QCL76688.1 RiPP maturation radical SAM protein 1 [Agrobacterium tumefaciens]QCL82208.1 RiPP maturation radical SAM protein 1 [Agrobacterium tumefaciens]CUX65218.1 conserved hypothetical protein [Agrobacterium sp. NCPPB 925]